MANLVIVESPAKAKTISKYLGSGFTVRASMGHLRDLPKSKLGVDIEGGFIPDYRPIKGREDTIAELKSAADKSERVYLATDPDREGEAISWHLKELLNLPDEKICRVTFNEITKNVVVESIKNPRSIDQDLVDAQQARRLLDRIVGYQLSPLLWRKVRRGLSAGRVQSVATRLVTDREEEIRAFRPEEYWLLTALFDRIDSEGGFAAKFFGDEKGRIELHSEEEVKTVISAVESSPFTVGSVKRAEKKRTPVPPFITSTLQQEASRRLNMSPRRTMSIAQQLYEGVDIKGEGTIGLITYMRTDSLRISEEALSAAKDYIIARYGEKYYAGKPRRFKSKKDIQDAHEAIRPSIPRLDPESIKGNLTNDQYRLYRLIWSRFIASQMAPAVYDSVVVDVISAGYIFRGSFSSQKFSGYTAVYEESRDDEGEEKELKLPNLREGEKLKLNKLEPEQNFTKPPARYTEATLIKALEEKGIGRPSTYAPTISTILDREYVVKEDKYLRPTPLGEVVTALMKDKFRDIVDIGFTARMEDTLDSVEEGKKTWKSVLEEFYGDFNAKMKQAEQDLQNERIKVPDEESDEVCDVCGRKMVIKFGKFGRFLACPGYPECKFTKPLVVATPGVCPKCGSRILKKTSKKGYTYYGCEKNPSCDFMTWDVPVANTCPECGNTMFKKSGRGFKKPYCINEACSLFVPEEQRGGRKKPAQKAEKTEKAVPETKKVQPKKAAAKKTDSKRARAASGAE